MTASQNPGGTGDFDTLFKHLPDPVVEFEHDNGDPFIINANEAFIEVFAPNVSVVGRSLNDLIVPADCNDVAENFDQRTATGETNRAVVERSTHEGRRKFLYRGVPVENNRGFAIYSDVTEKLKQEQCLDVLQRILRHNLRNKVNVINGQVERALEADEDEKTHDALESVEETTNALMQLCTEAQTIRKVISGQTTTMPTNLKEVIDSATEDSQRRFTDASISVDCPDELEVQADGKLRTVVDSLIDNAIRHNTSSTPKVNISTSIVSQDRVELAIKDNGPGIPETERRIFVDDAEITPLSHGSGLGLWMVKWLTESYGGSLAIDTPQNGGSIIRLQFPLSDNW